MEFNLQASSQDFSGLDPNWIEDDQTSVPASNEGGLESKSTDSLHLHSVNLNPDARPFMSYENGNDLTIKITPSSQSNLTDSEYQRNNSSMYSKSESFDSWYAGPNTTPMSASSAPKYAQQPHQQQLPPRGIEANNRYASYNNMITSLGQFGSDQGQVPNNYAATAGDMSNMGGHVGSAGGLYGSRSASTGPSPRMASVGSLSSSQDDYHPGYGGNNVITPTNAMAYGGRPAMNRPMGGGMGGVGGGGVGVGGMGGNKNSPSYGAAVAAAQMASPYTGGGGGGGVGGASSYGMMQNAAMNRYGGGGTMGGGPNTRVSPPSGGAGTRYGGGSGAGAGAAGGVTPVYGAPIMGGHHMGYGQSMGGMMMGHGGGGGAGGHDMQGTIYEVQFKAAFRYFVMDPMNPVEVSVGEFVIVEGDRGEDLGIVTQAMSMMAFIELKCQMNNSSLDEHENSVKRILRIASPYERQQLPAKYYDEQQVIEYCNELISAKYQIPLIIVNAEYQFDRNKITLFYDATTRIDFRELVRDLYSTFKTRIWMKQVDDHKPFYPLQFATMSLATGAQFNP